MQIEVLSTGNELLDGSVVDTNASYFCERVFALGQRVTRTQAVPDDLPMLVQALRQISERADFVVVSGGLGPTTDDLTLDAIAQVTGEPLEVDPQVLARIKARFAQRQIRFSPNNERQARVPVGGQAVANPLGTAPMIVMRIGRADCHFLPGVPREYQALCDGEVIPRLERCLALQTKRVFHASRTLKTIFLPESHLDQLVKDLPQRHPQVYFGFRTKAPENHLKLVAQGASAEEAGACLLAAQNDARALLSDHLFGVDEQEFPEVVYQLLKDGQATVALAESCTGGLCASLLASVPGASEVLVSSAVVYQDQAKSQLLGISSLSVVSDGAVSANTTRALAQAARAKACSTYGLAITGWAGPAGGNDEDPVGTVYFCLTDGQEIVEKKARYFTSSALSNRQEHTPEHAANRTPTGALEKNDRRQREQVREYAAYQALDLLRRARARPG